MEIVLATGNKDKVREMKQALFGLRIKVLTSGDFPGFPKPRENGKTIEANALIKARAITKYTGSASLADDTGLNVRALKGRPGVYSSRYAGYGATYDDNCRKLLREMKGKKDRKAEFVTVIALRFPDGREYTVEGKVNGVITLEKQGEEGFGYDPVFRPAGKKTTFAQMSVAQKNRISHRGRALKKAVLLLKKLRRNLPK